jgi:hypothetical protein
MSMIKQLKRVSYVIIMQPQLEINIKSIEIGLEHRISWSLTTVSPIDDTKIVENG